MPNAFGMTYKFLKKIQKISGVIMGVFIIIGSIFCLNYGIHYHILYPMIKGINVIQIVFISGFSVFIIYLFSFVSAFLFHWGFLLIFYTVSKIRKDQNSILFIKKNTSWSIVFCSFLLFLIVLLSIFISIHDSYMKHDFVDYSKFYWFISTGCLLNISFFLQANNVIKHSYIAIGALLLPFVCLFVPSPNMIFFSKNIFHQTSFSTNENDTIIISKSGFEELKTFSLISHVDIISCINPIGDNSDHVLIYPHASWTGDPDKIYLSSEDNNNNVITMQIEKKHVSIIYGKSVNSYDAKDYINGDKKCKI